jgi:hypothetical protein
VSRIDSRRRRLLAAIALLTVTGAGRAHTPYRQWVVYRRKHLLIGTTRADPNGYRVGKQLAQTLTVELPASQARVARARDARRLASLMSTGQLQTALLDAGQAAAMIAGHSPFEDTGPIDLHLLLTLDRHLFVAVVGFPDHHAWLVTRALDQAGYGAAAEAPMGAPPLHPGSRAYVEGEPMPDPPLDEED